MTTQLVRVTNASKVSPPVVTRSKPSSVNLSFFDFFWAFVPPIQRILLYQTQDSSFPDLVQTLKESLSRALTQFPTLAGKLVYSPDSGELEIDLAAAGGCGVDFLVAESDLDFRKLAGDEVHDVAAFRALVPSLEIADLPASLMAVQVTRFRGGGAVIGLAVHHVAVDGSAMWRFVKAWAEICKDDQVETGSHVASWDRSSLRSPSGREASKVLLKTAAPELPKLAIYGPKDQPEAPIMRRTFIVSLLKIQSLKTRVKDCLSTFVTLSAHIWKCSLHARDVAEDEDTCLFFLADCRTLTSPHMGEGYFGNCVRPHTVRAKASQLMGPSGFAFSTSIIHQAVGEAQVDPNRDIDRWPECLLGLPKNWINVAGSPRFCAYQTDFGWGRPARVELVSMNHEGLVVLGDARDEEGGIQVSIALSPTHMHKFASLFLDGFNESN